MGDQGAGGGIESHMPTHRRQDSGDEPMPTEPTPETMNPPAESEPQDFAPPPQDLPRAPRELGENESAENAPVVSTTPLLSRNPSTCSNSSIPKPQEYLAVHEVGHRVERRPSPVSRSPSSSSRPLEPPVTKATLSELDVTKIIHNPKLRHDINFDPELHFRPNLDGEKGKRKQEKANQFWNTLLEQLALFAMDRDTFHSRYGTNGDWCLPSLLRAVREIIETLVPQRDRELLNEGLNVDLLMQQFNRGVADLEGLAQWLSGVLKLHCAPMRDEWVDEMYQELSNGNRNNDVAELVKGMRNLLSVLEAMKLDVANHQIRCLRPLLIEDTVHFEQRFFLKKMETGRFTVAQARSWYREAREAAERVYGNSLMLHAQSFGEMTVFFDALVKLILPSRPSDMVPQTFVFDEDRIAKLRSDLYDSICLEICMRKYEELDRLSRLTQFFPGYISDERARSTRLSGDFNFAAPTSRPSSLAFSDRGSNASSPRSSGLFAQPSPAVDAAEGQSRASNLYASLLALLQTAPPASSPSQRWRVLAGDMAPQILRFVNAPLALPGFEAQLRALLTDPSSDAFCEVENQFQQRLGMGLAKRVGEFKNLNGVGLFSVATGGRIHGPGRSWEPARDAGLLGSANAPREPREEAGLDDITVRLSHLGILHWRVWGQLAYEGDIECEL